MSDFSSSTFLFFFFEDLACYSCRHRVRCTSAAVVAYLMKNHKMGMISPCEHLSSVILICSRHTNFQNGLTVSPSILISPSMLVLSIL